MNREMELAEAHAEWRELCALATTGTLEPVEWERLRLHLADCASCRTALSEYRAVVREGVPLLADNLALAEGEEPVSMPLWNAEAAKRRLFAALDLPNAMREVPASVGPAKRQRRAGVVLWAGIAAALLVIVGVGSYQWGKRSVHVAAPTPSPLFAKVKSLTAEKTSLDQRLDAESASFLALQKQTDQARSEITKLQSQLQDSAAQVTALDNSETTTNQQLTATIADRDSLAAKLQDAQQAYRAVQTKLTGLQAQRAQDMLHYASLDVEVNDLTNRLHDAESRVKDENQYLSADRDIRELMGARQLYIADVVDVDQNGDRRKPFGRVFYTKGKSLIFYAFDLNQQPGVRDASYQAWARQGSDNARPVSLGIFYVDSEANRRWVLKTNDPKVLAQINSVFVTVEPKGGSKKPTTKPLLYAYLRTETPNHP